MEEADQTMAEIVVDCDDGETKRGGPVGPAPAPVTVVEVAWARVKTRVTVPSGEGMLSPYKAGREMLLQMAASVSDLVSPAGDVSGMDCDGDCLRPFFDRLHCASPLRLPITPADHFGRSGIGRPRSKRGAET